MSAVTDSIMLTTPKAFSPVRYINPLKRGLSTPIYPQPSRQFKQNDKCLSDFVQRAQNNSCVSNPTAHENGSIVRRPSPERSAIPSSFASAAQQWAQKCAANAKQQTVTQGTSANPGLPPANDLLSPTSYLFNERDKAGIIGLLNEFSVVGSSSKTKEFGQGGFTPRPFTPIIFHAQEDHQPLDWSQLGMDENGGNDEDILRLYSAYDYWDDTIDPVLQTSSEQHATELEINALSSDFNEPSSDNVCNSDVPFELEAMTLSSVEISSSPPRHTPSSYLLHANDRIAQNYRKNPVISGHEFKPDGRSEIHVANRASFAKPKVYEARKYAPTARDDGKKPVVHVGPLCSCDEGCDVDHGLRKQRIEIDRACKQLGLSEVRLERNLYECPSCKRTFKSSTVARRHITTHYETRPYYCIYCLGKFSRDDAVLRHVHTRCPAYCKRDKPRRKSTVEVQLRPNYAYR